MDDFFDFDFDCSIDDEDELSELVQSSTQHFKNLFQGDILDDSEMHSAAMAMVLWQNLSRAGYKTNIIPNDDKTEVTVKAKHGQGLINQVEYLLETLTSLLMSTLTAYKSHQTIHRLSSYSDKDNIHIKIEFMAV